MRRIVLALALVGLIGFAMPQREASAGVLRNGARAVGRVASVRLYYSNAFRGYIPGTGYGGFARPAFGYRGY